MRPSKPEKALAFALMRLASLHRPSLSTRLAVHYYAKWGMKFRGTPNYISSKVWFDGTDYSLIELGAGCTLSSYIRVLTHDWAPHTILRGLGYESERPVGRILPVSVGDHAFVGTGSVIMPGCTIGRCSLIGAGTVARGDIPPYSVVIGSPGRVVGDARDYCARRFPDVWAELESSSADGRAAP